MYLRTTQRKNADGSTVSYYQLAHNVRDPDSGRPVADIIHNFGRADQLDREQLVRLCRSIARVGGLEVRYTPPWKALTSMAPSGLSLESLGWILITQIGGMRGPESRSGSPLRLLNGPRRRIRQVSGVAARRELIFRLPKQRRKVADWMAHRGQWWRWHHG